MTPRKGCVPIWQLYAAFFLFVALTLGLMAWLLGVAFQRVWR